jgi:UDP-N-acetylmuramoylalanine--D-glutamate ligase
VFQCAQSKATVVGLGSTGLSLVRFLRKRGASVTVIDSSNTPPALGQLRLEFPDVTFHRTDIDNDALPTTDFVALSPGVPRASYAIKRALDSEIPVYGDIELFAREVPTTASIYGVTGSNGKTTTTALAGELSKRVRPDTRVAGNIGVPILDALQESPACTTWVLELSSFQLESTASLRLDSAAVINVTDNHLDRYPSFFSYAAAKERVFDHAAAQVLNRADPWSMSMRKFALPASSFGADEPNSNDDFGMSTIDSKPSLVRGAQHILAADELGVSGAHNIQNALAALALVDSLNVPINAQQQVLRDFIGMPHRCQLVGLIDGVRIIDDSKATTVVATQAALDGLPVPTWLIAGGDGKGQHFDALALSAAKHCRAVHLIGRDAAAIASALAASGVPYETFSSLEEATRSALEAAKPNDQILLSPACASWDMFRNYGHRAEVFVNTVAEWAHAKNRVFQRRGVPA